MKLVGSLFCVSAAWAGSVYYVDCAAGNDAAAGLSRDTAWRSVRALSEREFHGGDTILLKRGTQCSGTLWPKGSGTANAPIVLDAYGSGPPPKITAEPGAEAALRLFDQEYWTVRHLELTGGDPHGIYISGTHGVLHGVHLRELIVHGVSGEPKNKEGGLVVIAPGSVTQRFDDVLVEGVTAYGTSQWAGILVGSVAFGFLPEAARSTNVTIRDSLVHDVAGDGIVLFQVNRGRIEDSVAWHTGMQLTETIGTPNGIWTWMCGECAVRRCEAFLTDSPGIDGGAFDIDYGDTGNIVEDSYGHDTQGYCVAIFGAGQVTAGSVFRRNVCAANGRSPRLAAFEGAVFLSTWNAGRLKGIDISENRIFWHPPIAAAAVVNVAEIDSGGSFVRNTIETTVPEAIRGKASLRSEGNTIRQRAAQQPPAQPGQWRLYAAGQAALVSSAYRQFHAAGLEVTLSVPAGESRDIHWDRNLGGIAVSFDDVVSGVMKLVSPSGAVVWRKEGPIAPGDLGLALRAYLGAPDYTQLISER